MPAAVSFGQKMPPIGYPEQMDDKKMKKEFRLLCQNGYELYQANCSVCHGPNQSSRVFPTFTEAQLLNYSLRTSTEHKTVFQRQPLTDGELNLVLTFLKYLKQEQ
jgi:hypothetical protein